MDEWIKQGHWWWLLLVPIATFVFALAGSWWGSQLGKITEHKQWLRNQKLEIYADALTALQSMLHDAVEMHDGGRRPTNLAEGAKAAREANAHMLRLRLFAPESLQKSAELAHDRVFELIRHIDTDEFSAAGEDASQALAEFHYAATADLHSTSTRHI